MLFRSKGQDLLLQSLIEWERAGGRLQRPACVVICGEAAFMQGRRHMAKLRRLAAQLKSVRVVFPGHVTGDRKRAFFGLADVYVFPSRHESYGLTLMEALAAGRAAVALETHGARSVMRPEFGRMVADPRQLAPAIVELLANDAAREAMGASARAYAKANPFSTRAAELAAILLR